MINEKQIMILRQISITEIFTQKLKNKHMEAEQTLPLRNYHCSNKNQHKHSLDYFHF